MLTPIFAGKLSIMQIYRSKMSFGNYASGMELKSTNVMSGIELCKLTGRWPYRCRVCAIPMPLAWARQLDGPSARNTMFCTPNFLSGVEQVDHHLLETRQIFANEHNCDSE